MSNEKSQSGNQFEQVDRELPDKQEGKLTKIYREGQLFATNIINKIGEIPAFGKEIINSSDKLNEKVFEHIKNNQDVITKMIENEIAKDNPSQEHLYKLLDEQSKIREDALKIDERGKKHNTETLILVGGLVATVITTMINNRNRA